MLCAIAVIDPTATERLIKLGKISERFGIPFQDVHGHITLATYIGDDEDSFTSSCKALLSGHSKFPVYYDDVEVWTSTSGAKSFIVAVPRKEPVITAIQKEIVRHWTTSFNKWTQENTWNPHTSLLYVPGADLSPVADAMHQEFEPFVTQIARIDFTRVYDNGYEIIDSIELR